MKLRTILVCVCAMILAFGVFAQTQSGKPKMVVTQNTYNAGEIFRTGKNIEHAFIIKNQGTADLKILTVTPG